MGDPRVSARTEIELPVRELERVIRFIREVEPLGAEVRLSISLTGIFISPDQLATVLGKLHPPALAREPTSAGGRRHQR